MKHIPFFILPLIAVTTLSGCGQLGHSMPTLVNEQRAELVEQSVLDRQNLENVNEAYLNMLAEQGRKYGDGPVDLTVTYDPKSTSFTAMKAIDEVGKIAASLRKKGVGNIRTQTLVVKEQDPSLMVAFDTVGVQAPTGCAQMPGINSNQIELETNANYRLGCSIETNIARQVSRPADLRGQSEMDASDGRTHTNVIDANRAGIPERATEALETFGSDDI